MVHHFAVIGNPIEHSLSPVIHQYFAQQTNIELSYDKIKGSEQFFEQQVSDFFTNNGKGLNITLPFKQRAFALVENKTLRCQLAGATNTLWIQDNQLYADNTDGIGLLRDLARHTELSEKNILILGAGGAARGIIAPLLAINPASLTVANRTIEKGVKLKEDFPQINYCGLNNLSGLFDVIINATSASLDNKMVAFPKLLMQAKPFCYDLAYCQKKATPFVDYAQKQGCKAIDGLGMLIEQAAESFFIWNKIMPQTNSLLAVLRQN